MERYQVIDIDAIGRYTKLVGQLRQMGDELQEQYQKRRKPTYRQQLTEILTIVVRMLSRLIQIHN